MSQKKRHQQVELIKQGVFSGDRYMLSRAISLFESKKDTDKESAEELLRNIIPFSGGALRLAVTGIPGAGKSTFIEAFGSLLTGMGKKVAVLTVDPSSAATGGSLLADKTRMPDLSSSEKAFIRPTASGGIFGGIASNTRMSVLLCEAAGYDVVIIETVGVGQSEVMVNYLADIVLFLTVTGTGDELQSIKKGVLEIADMILINKCEKERLNAAKELKDQLEFGKAFIPRDDLRESDPEVKMISSLEGTGIADVWEWVVKKEKTEKASNAFYERRKQQELKYFSLYLKEALVEKFFRDPVIVSELKRFKRMLSEGKLVSEEAASQLLGIFYSNK